MSNEYQIDPLVYRWSNTPTKEELKETLGSIANLVDRTDLKESVIVVANRFNNGQVELSHITIDNPNDMKAIYTDSGIRVKTANQVARALFDEFQRTLSVGVYPDEDDVMVYMGDNECSITLTTKEVEV